MNRLGRRIATLLIFAFFSMNLLACQSIAPPLTGSGVPPQAYAAAQSTLDYGQSQLEALSHQATVVGMDLAQAANAAAQATLDTNERQNMELAYQGTAVSLNMAQAAATQQFIAEQTQRMWDAESTALSQAATATYSAYRMNVTQTAQVQAILYVQATETAQAHATQTAYSLTATPWAMLQADIVRARGVAERSALWGEFVVTPLKVILITLVVLLLIVGGVMAYRRLIPVLELRLRTIARYNDSPLVLVNGMFVDSDPSYRPLPERTLRQHNQSQLPGDLTTQVEIIGPSEPSIINWITEAEQKLRSDGWIQP